MNTAISSEGARRANRLKKAQPARWVEPAPLTLEPTRAFAERLGIPLWTLEFSDPPPLPRWRPPSRQA
jgi:hypothetical protein